MIYYRVKPEFDNVRKFNTKRRQYDGIWIDSELYTPGEIKRLMKQGVFVPCDIFEKIEISRRKTYWFFGARFGGEIV